MAPGDSGHNKVSETTDLGSGLRTRGVRIPGKPAKGTEVLGHCSGIEPGLGLLSSWVVLTAASSGTTGRGRPSPQWAGEEQGPGEWYTGALLFSIPPALGAGRAAAATCLTRSPRLVTKKYEMPHSMKSNKTKPGMFLNQSFGGVTG